MAVELCRAPECQAEIEFAYKFPDEFHDDGRPKTTPVDNRSVGDPKGNLAVWRDNLGVLRFRYLKKGEEPASGEKRGRTHFATCVAADQFRRKKASR